MVTRKIKRWLATKIISKDTERCIRTYSGIGYKLLSQFLIDKEYPTHISLELSRLCNYNCLMCARQRIFVKSGFMPMEMAKKVIDEMKDMPTSYALHMFGEPLLHRDFSEIVRYIKKTNPSNKIILTTNGTFLIREIAYLNIDRIYVSVPSLEPENYHLITTSGDLEWVKERILAFLDMHSKTKLLVRYFGKECPGYWKWKALGIPFEIKKFHNYAGGADDWTGMERTDRRYPCYHPWFTLGITFDGDIRICCTDWYGGTSLGNIKETKIKEAWAKKKTSYPVCERCDVWQYKPNIFFRWQY